MHLLVGLLLFLTCFPVSFSHADCHFVPYKQVKTAEEAAALFKARTGKAYACGLYGRGYDHGYYEAWKNFTGKEVWGCETEDGQCDLVYSLPGVYERGMTKGLAPGGEGWYETWPDRGQVYCDRAFGCRPLR